MAINFTPDMGQILECNFGEYAINDDGSKKTNDFDFNIPPEMIKNRLVVVMNGKISGGSVVVVPLSTTKDDHKTEKGLHIELASSAIPDLVYFSQQTRWAKGDLIAQVSKQRLNMPRTHKRGREKIVLGRVEVANIQRAVIKTINASSMITPAPAPEKP